MRWDKEAESDLRKYPGLLNATKNLSERIEYLEASSGSLKGSVCDDVPVHGGGSHYEDRILNNLVERERKRMLLDVDEQLLTAIERGLSALTDEERMVIDGFYIYPVRSDKADALAARIPCGRATVFRIRDRALYKFTVSMYGLMDL